MKKFLRLASALFLSTQAFLSIPLNVLANETHNHDDKMEQVQSSTESSDQEDSSSSTSSDSTTSTSTSKESSTTETSSESVTQPSSSDSNSTSQTTDSTTSITSGSQEQPKEKPTQKPQKPAEPTQPSQPAQESHKQEVAPKSETTLIQEPSIDQQVTSKLAEPVPSANVTEDGSFHFEKEESVDSFVRKIGESARKIGKEKELYASVMVAQAILESASGQSKLAQAPNYNLFGIKGTHNGKSVSMATQEDLGNGTLYTTQAGFRVYENYEDCFNDYATLLKEGITGDSEFYAGVWKSNAKTYQEATKFLTGRYATDTQYNQKLNGLIETYDLTQFDKEIQGAPINTKGYKVPLDSYTISSPFGPRGGEFHRGLDLAAAQGEPIHATKGGKVIKAEYHYSWGNYVVIQHEDGTTALYAHQQQYSVKVGDTVVQGQTIGYVGSTGNSTGSHLHLELCQDSSLSQGSLVDPQPILFGY